VINTYGYANAFGPTENGRLLAAAGLELVAHINIRMCNNIISTRPDAKPFDWELLRKRMTVGEQELTRLADCLSAGKKRIKGHGPQNLVGTMIRKKIPEAIANYYQTLGVNQDTCIRCMACVDHCPTGSIHFDEETGFSFHAGCTACMRCYNFCPTGSITTDGVYYDPRQFPRYQGPRG
jgi:NAD-dependent dihydropyrimidine dehydrogenase PreA subunit